MRNRALTRGDPDLAAFAQDLETQKRSPHTIKNYTLMVNQLREWLETERNEPDILLREATAADLKQYQLHLVSQRKLSKNTLYTTIKAIQAFYRFLQSDVAETLRPPRRSQSLPKYLTESEAKRLLEGAASDLRDETVIRLLLYGGFRVGELVRLEVENFDFDERTIRVTSGKGDKDRLVVVPPHVMEAVRAWLTQRPKTANDYLFPGKGGKTHLSEATIQRAVSKAAKAAGIDKKVTPHTLRHTLATTLLRRGGDIRFIQRILGHSSIATTQVYTHLDDRELKRMYDQATPEF